MLGALGIDLTLSPERVSEILAEAGITFAFASAFHPGFRHAGPTRSELGVPTVFNFLGPLCNPARAEANAFILGNGSDKPRGIMSVATAPNATATDAQIGTINTGAAGDFAATAPANALIDLVYALGAPYRANATFLMNSRVAGMVRKLRDGDGRYLWSDSLAAGEPARLLGYPVMISEDMPAPAGGSKSIAFGDFRQAYTIAERPDLRILRDPYSAKPHVLFYATKRVGGGVVDPRAIKMLNFAV